MKNTKYINYVLSLLVAFVGGIGSDFFKTGAMSITDIIVLFMCLFIVLGINKSNNIMSSIVKTT